jgi:protein tyrosine phosphatase
VVGYKERKRWICAQGPLVATLEDFWRMIHEQGVELIIMLTNLEEYNRIKCAQYWPGAGTSTFGQLRVCFVQEHRCRIFTVHTLQYLFFFLRQPWPTVAFIFSIDPTVTANINNGTGFTL